MTNRSKAKGDRAELEVQGLIRDLLGVPARRKLGAGRLDDMGDIDGVDSTCIQVVSYSDIGRAIREKLPECEAQQERMGADFGATFVRRPGGKYVVVMTPQQWAAYARESMYVDYSKVLWAAMVASGR
jgi:hypothetical protein